MGAAALLLIGVLLPSAYGLLAGYQIQSLRSEAQRLAGEQASLELQEAKLVSPARMEELARQQQFIDPEPEKVVYLDSEGRLFAGDEPEAVDARSRGSHAGNSIYPAAAVAAVVVVACGPASFSAS